MALATQAHHKSWVEEDMVVIQVKRGSVNDLLDKIYELPRCR